MIASKQAKEVIGVELNRDAVRDAIGNAKGNGVKNIRFYQVKRIKSFSCIFPS